MLKISIFVLVSIISINADEAALEEFTNGNNLFTGLIYKELLKDNQENFVISPFSIQTVLALTQTGAKDETALEIREALHLLNTTEETQNVYSALLPTLKSKEEYSLETANKIYVKNNYVVKEDFRKTASDVFLADIENVDFSQKVEAAETINRWVENQTHNKIRNLIDSKNLGDDTKIILINALYFKGKWITPFESSSTHKRDFYKNSQDVVKVDMMHNSDIYSYYESSELNCKFLELPYQGKDISMVLVLPNTRDGLQALETQIERVFTAPNFTQERVSVAMPKFAIENKIQLKKILTNLGVNRAFSDDADFSGIAGKKGDLLISDVVQKTFINVTETGTEAAAATAVQGIRIALSPPILENKTFIVDHPFIFYIISNKIVLFGGRILNFK